MEKKEDRRIRHTKKAIKNAFYQLLKEKPAYRISVTEVCGRADINRSSFYAHYVDMSALINEMEEEVAVRAFEEFSLFYKVDDYTYKTLRKLLTKLKADSAMNILFLDGHSSGVGQRTFEKLLEEKTLAYWLSFGTVSEEQARIILSYMVRGGYGVLKQWHDEGFATDTEVVCETLATIMDNTLKGIVYR